MYIHQIFSEEILHWIILLYPSRSWFQMMYFVYPFISIHGRMGSVKISLGLWRRLLCDGFPFLKGISNGQKRLTFEAKSVFSLKARKDIDKVSKKRSFHGRNERFFGLWRFINEMCCFQNLKFSLSDHADTEWG